MPRISISTLSYLKITNRKDDHANLARRIASKIRSSFCFGKNIFLKTGKGKEEEEEKGIKRYRSILDA